MLRPTLPADTDALITLTDATGFFRPHEVETLGEVLDDYHATARDQEGHLCFSLVHRGVLQGFCYYGPVPMTQGTWQLWWIVVRKDCQARGLGGRMLASIEKDLRKRKARVLFVETSSQPLYAPTRRFYAKHGYDRHAVLRDFYAEGDSMVVYRKVL